MVDERPLQMVNSFREVIESPLPLNLQMFHREGSDNPALPNIPSNLLWPLKSLLQGDNDDLGVVVDMATRVSARSALTWWHLDDGFLNYFK